MAAKKATRGAGGLYGTELTYTKRVVLMFCVFILMWALASFAFQIAGSFAPAGTRKFLLLTSVFQNLICFAGTAVVCALFLSKRPMEMLGVNRSGTWLSVGGVLLVYAVGLPFMNQVIYWNAQMHLPGFMSAVESTLRGWEAQAVNSTNVMLGGTSWSALAVNILCVGVVTGVCEELLFRGTFQRIISSGPLGIHLSIWITAVIFSLLHFQFFGFLPRVILGAFFGYLFYWTGSIWIAATAHVINNSVYVITKWLEGRGIQWADSDTFGVTTHGFPAMACVSLVLILFIIFTLRPYLFKTHGHG